MNSTLVRACLAASAIAAAATTASAQTTINLVASKDTTLYESASGSIAGGANGRFFVGRVGATSGFAIRRGLVKWDIAGSIPAGSRILSVRLDLWVDISSAFLPEPTSVHRILQDWSEGTVPGTAYGSGGGGAGGPSAPGSTTWIHTNYPSQFWTNPGGDFNPTPSFTFGLPGIGPIVTDPLAGLVADAQDMLDNPGNNHGWLFKTSEVLTSNARGVNSKDNSFFQPKLQITYLTPGQVGTYGVGCTVGSGTFDLNVTGTATGGNVLPITYSNAPTPSLGANFFSLDIDPIGQPLFPGCSAYLPLAGNIIPGDAFVVAGGVGSTNFTVPTGFPGFLINVQAAVLDATPLNFSLSNSGVMLTN